MEKITREQILMALGKLSMPGQARDVVSAGLISDIVIANNRVMFAITADSQNTAAMEPLRREAERIVSALPGVEKVMVALTAERKQAPPKTANLKSGIPGLRHIVAVASGKGGVGKSTMAVNLALALTANGLRVAVLDADVYGPSLPKLLGIMGKPKAADMQGKLMQPMEAYGLKVMSMGFLVPEDTPMIWRGPMVSSALEQMLRDVQWGELDVLVVDMPPGTGDAQLTLAQRVALSGAVIVSTPQDIALVDARKGLNMFRKVAVPVLGFVENMSFFLCPHCGERSEIFGHGGAREEAAKLDVPFLGEVPLHLDIRTTSDSGHPIVVSRPDSPHAQIYRNIAGRVWKQLSANQRGPRAAPRIVVR